MRLCRLYTAQFKGQPFTFWVIIDLDDIVAFFFFFSWHMAKKHLKEEWLSSAQDAIWASSSCFHQLPFPNYPLKFSLSYRDLICLCVSKCPPDLINLHLSVLSPLSPLFPLFSSFPPHPLPFPAFILLPETWICRKSPDTLAFES